MSGALQKQHQKKILRTLMRASSNKKCADCGEQCAVNVDTTHGIFICTNCGGIHRELGDIIKSVSMGNFVQNEINLLQSQTNEDFNRVWMAKWRPGEMPLPLNADDNRRRAFLQAKYVEKRWYSKRAQQSQNQASKEAQNVSNSPFQQQQQIGFGIYLSPPPQQQQQQQQLPQNNIYGQPTNGYGQPTNGFSQPTNGFGQPTNGFGQPTNGYGQPTNGYDQPTNGYGQTANGYDQPTNGYGQPTNGYGQPTNGYGQFASNNDQVINQLTIENRNLNHQLELQMNEILRLQKLIEQKDSILIRFKSEILNDKQTIDNLNSKIKEQEIQLQIYEKQPPPQPNKNITEPEFRNKIEYLDSETIQKLKKIKELGRGGSGTVYQVTKSVIREETYVLKIMTQITQHNFQNFIKENEILSHLNHPNVIKTYGIFLSDETNPPSILLEYCPNDIFHSIKDKKLSKSDIVMAIYSIAQGMKYVHSNKIIHRDLKPSNILIADDGTIKISDFGISKIISSEEQFNSMTGSIGTLFFMAPEVCNNEKYNEKVDVFSFGVLAYFMLNEGEMPKLSITQFLNGVRPALPDSFTEFSKNMINACLNSDPNLRPSFGLICDEIDQNPYQLCNLSFDENNEIKVRMDLLKKRIPSY